MTSARQMEIFRKQEEELEFAIAEHQKLFEVLQSDTRAQYCELEIFKKYVDEAMAKVLELIPQYEARLNNYCNSSEKTKNAKCVLAVLNEQLDKTRMEIANLQNVSILVHDDGRIEVKNAECPEIAEESIFSRITQLICVPTLDNARIHEVKAIAQLQIMVKHFQDSGRDTEISFANDKVQALWKKISA